MWTPVAFSAILGVITLVTYVASGLSDAWIVPFVAFQPIMFVYVAACQRRDRQHIKLLEARFSHLSVTNRPPDSSHKGQLICFLHTPYV